TLPATRPSAPAGALARYLVAAMLSIALVAFVGGASLAQDPPTTPAPATNDNAPAPGPSTSNAPAERSKPGSDPIIRSRPKHINAATEQAIQDGLRALALMQGGDGAWRSEGATGGYPCTMTGIAGLALLAGGHSPTRGEYAPQLRRAIRFLLKSVDHDGVISADGEGRSMYGHGFGTLFLAEVYGMSGDAATTKEIGTVLAKAVQLIGQSQSKAGGWYYSPGSGEDEGSVTVTQLQALRACKNAGIVVPDSVFKRAIEYLGKCQMRDGGISYRLGMTGSRPPITAAAVATIFYAGKYDDPVATKALAYCRRYMGPDWNQGHYWYTHFYLAQAYYQASAQDWDKYFPSMRDQIVGSQLPGGRWPNRDVGSLFSSAVALIILQLPYQNLPVYQR
ncbi:MAG: prenyltransferase/squalene oxidase repeat-containing protein, partial [Planctomycetota bacterium]